MDVGVDSIGWRVLRITSFYAADQSRAARECVPSSPAAGFSFSGAAHTWRIRLLAPTETHKKHNATTLVIAFFARSSVDKLGGETTVHLMMFYEDHSAPT
jgi:hypothetical protein